MKTPPVTIAYPTEHDESAEKEEHHRHVGEQGRGIYRLARFDRQNGSIKPREGLIPRWICLDGPPGLEKTSLVKEIARPNNYHYALLSPAEFSRCCFVYAKRLVRDAFAQSSSKNAPSILLIGGQDIIAENGSGK